MTDTALTHVIIRTGAPVFADLPWELPLTAWQGVCQRLEEVQRGPSRHPVVFVNYDGELFALKELPIGLAEQEFQLLTQLETMNIPAVKAVGHLNVRHNQGEASILITRYLDRSLPYWSLFRRSGLDRYQEHLLDAMAGLLVQLHLAGIYWGDCSLSNTLFRRDAGALRAYLVDAETAEIHPARLEPTLRVHDLQIMEENVDGELRDLLAAGEIPTDAPHFLLHDTGAYVRNRYQALWNEITREQTITPGETYRIQERIRALNELGFSVGGIEMEPTQQGDRLRLRVMVTDRNFHRNQLMELTGLAAEEMQARQMMNEIQQLKAHLSRDNNRSTPLSVAAYHWLEQDYQPVIARLQPLLEIKQKTDPSISPSELYCEILEHKWYLSEQAHRDVGHLSAVEDYLHRFGESTSANLTDT